MMLENYFRAPQLPTGRRIFVLHNIVQLAQARGPEAETLTNQASAALESDRKLRNRELEYRSVRTSTSQRHSRGARELDGKVNRACAALDSNLESQITAFGEDSPRGRAAVELRQASFPDGLAAVTQLSYIEQHASIAAFVRAFTEQPQLTAHIGLLGLAPMLERVSELNDAHGELLGQTRTEQRARAAELAEAQRKGHRNLLRVVARILADHGTDEPADLATRRELLAHFDAQNEALRELRRARRRVTDIDPDTGEENREEATADAG